MTDRELMQQALDALEHIIYWDNEKPEWEYAHAAITALREALAQPEQEPVACQYAKDVAMPEYRCAGKCQYAQPEQEPVAWMYDLKQRGSFEGVSTEYSRVKLSIGENWVPLYTAPPQRKPLTPDDIIRMAREAGLHLYVNDLTEEPYALIVERFAALVAAAEREACAQVCDLAIQANTYQGNDWTLSSCAKAIRARGEK